MEFCSKLWHPLSGWNKTQAVCFHEMLLTIYQITHYNNMDTSAPGLNHLENLKPHYLTLFSYLVKPSDD